MKTSIVIDISPQTTNQNNISGKILFLELGAEMLLTNKTAGFFKKWELKFIFDM